MKVKQPVTIDDLEETARQDKNGNANYRIGNQILEVIIYQSNGIGDERIVYLFCHNQINKEKAIEFLKLQK